MKSQNRLLVATAVGSVVVAALVLWTPLDLYTSGLLAVGGMTLCFVPRKSIAEGLRIGSRRTGVGWGWWLLALLAFVAFVRVTQGLGAPAVLVRCSSTVRPIRCPTGYGIGTALVLLGGYLLLLAAGFARTYLAFNRHPPEQRPAAGRATLEGQFEPEGAPLETPVAGAQAIWYAYEIADRPTDGVLGGCWLPIASGDRSTPCWTAGPRGDRFSVDPGSPRLAPAFLSANVASAQRVVEPDESLPPGIARLERERTDGDPAPERTEPRRYREWYVTSDDLVVFNGPVATQQSGHMRDFDEGDARTFLGVGTTYPDLCSSLQTSTVLWGSAGLALAGAGLGIVLLAVV